MGTPLPPNGGGAPPPSPVPFLSRAPTSSPPLCLALGGGSSTVLGGFPSSPGSVCARMACAAAQGCPPLPLWLESCPIPLPLSLHAVRLGRTLLGGVPYGCWWCGGVAPPGRACRALGAHAAQGKPLPHPLPSGSGEAPPPALACHALGAHAALRGGPPISTGIGLHAACARGMSPVPSAAYWCGGFPPSWPGMPCAGSASCRTRA